MTGDVVELVPRRSCANGPECVTALLCGRPTVLSRFNPYPRCYCCMGRHRACRRAERPVSTHDLMTERTAVAA